MWMPGMWELIIVLVIVLIVFGAGKLPSVGKSLGEGIKGFKDSVSDKNDDDSGSSGGTASPKSDDEGDKAEKEPADSSKN